MNKFIVILVMIGIWKGYAFLNEKYILRLIQEYSVYRELGDEIPEIKAENALTKKEQETFEKAIHELADRVEDIEPSVQRIYNNVSPYNYHLFPRNSWYNKKECTDYIDDELDSDIAAAVFCREYSPQMYRVEFTFNKHEGS